MELEDAKMSLRETLVTHYMDQETLIDIRVVLDHVDQMEAQS